MYHHFIVLYHDRRFINLSNYWVDNIHKSNELSYHFMINIAFTFWRTIWRTRSVLPFIITTMMTIIIPSFHALFHIVNHLSSFRLIIYCYHIHTIEWSKSTSESKVIICCYHIFSRNETNSIGRISSLFIKVLVIIIYGALTQTQCFIHIMHVRPNSMDLNPIMVHQNSNWCLTLLVR